MVIGCRGDKMKSLWAAAVLVLGLTLLMGCKEKKPEPEELLVLLELPEEMRLPPSSLEGDSAGSPPQAATARVRATASTRQTRVRREA